MSFLREDSVIQWIRTRAAARGLVADELGLTGDAGVVRLPGGLHAFSIDSHVEGIHFPASETLLRWVGRRAVVAAVSDVVVVGPAPYYVSWDLQIPWDMQQTMLQDLIDGLLDGLEDCSAKLVAGNLRFADRISIQVGVTGAATSARKTAKAGDIVALCDTVGDAWLDRVHTERTPQNRYCYPPNYSDVANALRPVSVLLSDLTDGLLSDLLRLSLRLGYQIELAMAALPRSQAWQQFMQGNPLPNSVQDLQHYIFGSDEYLLVCVLPEHSLQSAKVSVEKTGHSLYAVGSLKPGSGLKIEGAGLAAELMTPVKLISQKIADAIPTADAANDIDWNW